MASRCTLHLCKNFHVCFVLLLGRSGGGGHYASVSADTDYSQKYYASSKYPTVNLCRNNDSCEGRGPQNM